MQPPIRTPDVSSSRRFRNRERADLAAAAAGEHEITRLALPDQRQRQRRQRQTVRSAGLVLGLPPDAIEDMTMAKRGGLVAALRRQQQEAHHAAVALRPLRLPSSSQAFQIALISAVGQHALALGPRRAADRRDEVGRDQIFLRRPAQRRAERGQHAVGGRRWCLASTSSLRTLRRSALENSAAGSARQGFRCCRSSRICLGQRLDALAFPHPHRLITVEQTAQRQRGWRSRMRIRHGRRGAALDPLTQRSCRVARVRQRPSPGNGRAACGG